MAFVARVTKLKEETHNLTELRDLEELVIDTMGEDTWDAIMYFTEKRIEENKEESEYTKDAVLGYDTDLTALRGDVTYTIAALNDLTNYLNDTGRLNRNYLIEELRKMKGQLENSEGYM